MNFTELKAKSLVSEASLWVAWENRKLTRLQKLHALAISTYSYLPETHFCTAFVQLKKYLPRAVSFYTLTNSVKMRCFAWKIFRWLEKKVRNKKMNRKTILPLFSPIPQDVMKHAFDADDQWVATYSTSEYIVLYFINGPYVTFLKIIKLH